MDEIRINEQRQILAQTKRFLATSEEIMARRWATGRTSEWIIRASLTLVLLCLFSYSMAWLLVPKYTPFLIQDGLLELAAAILGGSIFVTLIISVVIRQFLLKRDRVLQIAEEAELSNNPPAD